MNLQYGRYRIIKELGKGNMGVVFQAHDPQIDRIIALKVLRNDRVTSEDFVARFIKEARAIGRLSHPQIVTIYDIGEDKGTIYIAMEYLKGRPLNEIMKNSKLSIDQSIEIIRQIAHALDYAHQQGIIHRDIKPSNIIVTPEFAIKLTDFGIARIEDSTAGCQTQVGEILGTPIYMSPEQVMGKTADRRSDLYAVGVLFYEMVVGKRPFSGKNLASIFNAITHDTPEPPAIAEPSIPGGLSDFIMKCLEKSPDKRFQTGQNMVAALNTLGVPKTGNDFEHKHVSKHTKRTRRLLLGFILILAVGSILGMYFFLHPKTDIDTFHTSGTTDNEDRQQEQKVQMTSATLKVTSEPEGANIYVDSVFRGRTPIDIPLPLGKYELRMSLVNYLAWEAQIELDKPGEMPLHIPMRSASATHSK